MTKHSFKTLGMLSANELNANRKTLCHNFKTTFSNPAKSANFFPFRYKFWATTDHNLNFHLCLNPMNDLLAIVPWYYLQKTITLFLESYKQGNYHVGSTISAVKMMIIRKKWFSVSCSMLQQLSFHSKVLWIQRNCVKSPPTLSLLLHPAECGSEIFSGYEFRAIKTSIYVVRPNWNAFLQATQYSSIMKVASDPYFTPKKHKPFAVGSKYSLDRWMRFEKCAPRIFKKVGAVELENWSSFFKFLELLMLARANLNNLPPSFAVISRFQTVLCFLP